MQENKSQLQMNFMTSRILPVITLHLDLQWESRDF
jgi:hypothetical protein